MMIINIFVAVFHIFFILNHNYLFLAVKVTCEREGRIYMHEYHTDCKAFTQATPTLAEQVHYCKAGLLFDLNTCLCNYADQVPCHMYG